jgi:hypothetical protein
MDILIGIAWIVLGIGLFFGGALIHRYVIISKNQSKIYKNSSD